MYRITLLLLLIFLFLMLFQCQLPVKHEIDTPHILDCSVLQQDSVLATKMQLTVKDKNILTDPDSSVLYKIMNKGSIVEKQRKARLDTETMSILNYYLLSGNNLRSTANMPIAIKKETTAVIYYKAGKTIELCFNDSLNAVSFRVIEKTNTFLLSDNILLKKLLRTLE